MAIELAFRATAGIAASALLAAPAFAHPGSHEGLSLAAIVEHFGTPYHLLPLVVVALIGLGYAMLKRRRQVREQIAATRRGKDRT